jgi:hypothetical protein
MNLPENELASFYIGMNLPDFFLYWNKLASFYIYGSIPIFNDFLT